MLFAATVYSGDVYARTVVDRYVHRLAPELFRIKNLGSALQRAAFRQPDLLPIYGSSELDSSIGPYHAQEFFRTYPSGFQVFPVGTQGTTALIILQKLAAVGPDLRGKKLVLCVSPTLFRGDDRVRKNYYAGNFSRLQASELAFSSELTLAFKQEAARRMLEYPNTLENDAVLRLALSQLARGSLTSYGIYYAMFPFGKLQSWVLHLEDLWETLTYIEQQPDLDPAVLRRPAQLDWPSILVQAEHEAQLRADNNALGFENDYWDKYGREIVRQRNNGSDRKFIESLRDDSDWVDLQLLIRGIREWGAEPLLVSVPLKGTYYDYWGVSPRARQAYYQKLRSVVEPLDVTLVTFEGNDADPYFNVDDRSHPSQEGWAHYDQAIDNFYHGRLP